MTNRLLDLFKFLLLAVLVYGLHYVAIRYYFYWTISWFDILMHFLGGFLVGYGVYVAFQIFGKRVRLIPVLISVLIVGLLWEYFEFGVGLTGFYEYGDMILDLIMDVLGGLTAYYLSKR